LDQRPAVGGDASQIRTHQATIDTSAVPGDTRGPRAPRQRFTGIEAARGIAALLVVVYHASRNIAEPRLYNTMLLDGHFEIFHVGVDFFFVLSGFIIAWMHWSDIGRPSRLKGYALRRLIRIYPPYWGILIPVTIAFYLSPGFGRGFDRELDTTLASLTLVPWPKPLIIGVAWTLVYEMMFYVLFGLAIVLGRWGTWLFRIWFVAILVAQAFPPLPLPLNILLSAYNLEFLLGVATAIFLSRAKVSRPALVAIGGGLAFASFMALGNQFPDISLVFRLAFGLPAAALIAGLVELERSGRLRVPSVLVFLGSASYAIYLIHPVVLAALIHLLLRVLPQDVPLGLVLTALVAGGTAAGCLYHVLIERPLTGILRRRFIGPSRHPGAASADVAGGLVR
jgi:peptidoglycan/LPS O-acetylase OafA/YrhL